MLYYTTNSIFCLPTKIIYAITIVATFFKIATLYCASMMILNTRMMTVHDEILSGKLIVPKNPEKSTIAMWIEYK